MKYQKFNINHYVKVKLTDIGIKELKRQHDDLMVAVGKDRPFKLDLDGDGYSKFQMHDLIYRFGHLVGLGQKIPFETEILIETEESSK